MNEIIRDRFVQINAAKVQALIDENEILKQEIRVAREAAEITANLVVKQFEETESVLRRFQDANAQRKAVLDSAAQVAIIAANVEGIIIVFNAGAENLLGYDAGEVIGLKTPAIFHLHNELEERRLHLSEKLGREIKTEEVFLEYSTCDENKQLEFTYVHKSGIHFPVSMSVNALRGPDGNVNGFLCFATDISDKKQSEKALRESERKYRLLVKNLPNIVYTGYPDGSIDVFDDKIELLTGYPKEDFLSRRIKWTDLIIEEDKEKVRNFFLNAMGKDNTHIAEYRIRAKNEEVLWIQSVSQILTDKDGKIDIITGFIHNITERKIQEEKLKKAYDDLELRVEKRTEELARANEELQKEIKERFQAEEALRESEQQLAGIMAAVTDRMSMIDENFNLVWVNDVARNMFGGDIVGKKCYHVYQQRQEPCDSCVIMKTFADGKVHEEESDAIGADGVRRVYWVTASVAARYKNGRPKLVIENGRNITERKLAQEALEASESKYRSIFENATEGIFQSTPEGLILTANPAFVNIMGYESLGLLLQEVRDMFKLFFSDFHDLDVFLKLMKKHGFVSGFETRFYRKDRAAIHVSLNVHAVCDEIGNILYYEGILEDITQKKRAEEFKIAKEAAEAATHAKSAFLANMSHEIRTPLNAIIGLTDLFRKTGLSDKQHDYLEKIHYSAHSLLGIINDILDFSKIEAGKLDMDATEFSLINVLDNLSDMFSDKASEKNIELVVSASENVPYDLVGDPLRLGQVLTNLTSNAIKFTHSGEVVVSVAVVEKDKSSVTLLFSVEDTGIGVPDTFLSRLFDSFTQADSSAARKYGGTGLGLAISKRLVEMMDGQIWAESKPESGSSFFFTARFGLKGESRKPRPVIPTGLLGLKVLVVDDNETAREIFQNFLSSFKFDVAAADSGGQAIELLKREAGDHPFELVLMDWRMPDMDGITTVRKMKDETSLADIPVIMMTAYGREEIMHQAETVGVNAFLIKPVKQSLLLDTIMNLFGEAPAPHIDPILSASEKDDPHLFKDVRILLVEDNAINRQVASELLEHKGLIVETAENGKEAVEIISEKEFELVLMDVQMPELDGYETTRLIRENPKFEDLPIIAMTAHAMKGDRERCLSAGMNDYISKPIDTKSLFSVLLKWIKSDQTQKRIDFLLDQAEGMSDSDFGMKLPDRLPGLDVNAVIQRLEGNRKLLKSLLLDITENHVGIAQQIRDAVNGGDFDAAERMAHTIKGIAGIFSAKELQKTALALEVGIRSRKEEAIRPLLENFEDAMKLVVQSCQILVDEIERMEPAEDIAPPSTIDLSGIDIQRISPQIMELATLLQNNDMDAEDHVEQLKTFLKDTGLQSEILDIQNKIQRLDFDNALKQLYGVFESLKITWEGTVNE